MYYFAFRLKKWAKSSNMTGLVKFETRETAMPALPLDDTALVLERQKTKPPRLYKVLLFNDDYTTMDFVIAVLQQFFNMNMEQAQTVMLKIHNEGSAVCGIYSRDVAETKVTQVSEFAQQHEHPLRCGMEEN
jgi:ATP-dependent Clp protease adaptor protein ClpS